MSILKTLTSTIKFSVENIKYFPIIANYLKDDDIDDEIKEKLVDYTIKVNALLNTGSSFKSSPYIVHYEQLKNQVKLLKAKPDENDKVPTLFEILESILFISNCYFETFDSLQLLEDIMSDLSRRGHEFDVIVKNLFINRMREEYEIFFLKKLLYTTNLAYYSKIVARFSKDAFHKEINEWFIDSDQTRIKLYRFTEEQITLSKFMYLLSCLTLPHYHSFIISNVKIIVDLVPKSLKLISKYHQSSAPMLQDFNSSFKILMELILDQQSWNEQLIKAFVGALEKEIENNDILFDLLYQYLYTHLTKTPEFYFKSYIKSNLVTMKTKSILIKNQTIELEIILVNYIGYFNTVFSKMNFESSSMVILEPILEYYIRKISIITNSKLVDLIINTVLLRDSIGIDDEAKEVPKVIVKWLSFVHSNQSTIFSEEQQYVKDKVFYKLLKSMFKCKVPDLQKPFIKENQNQIQIYFNNTNASISGTIAKLISMNLEFVNICLDDGITIPDNQINAILRLVDTIFFSILVHKNLATFLDTLPDPVKVWKRYISTSTNAMSSKFGGIVTLSNHPMVIVYYVRHIYGYYFEPKNAKEVRSNSPFIGDILSKLNSTHINILEKKLDKSVVSIASNYMKLPDAGFYSGGYGGKAGIYISTKRNSTDTYTLPLLTSSTSTSTSETTQQPNIHNLIWKNIILILLNNSEISTKWKINTIPFVSKLFFQHTSSILSNYPIESIRLASNLTHIGSNFCLFKNPPLHLVDYEIYYIPEKDRSTCLENLLALTQTFNTYLYKYDVAPFKALPTLGGKQTFVHYLSSCPKLTSLKLSEVTVDSKLLGKWNHLVNTNCEQSHVTIKEVNFTHFDKSVLGIENSEPTPTFVDYGGGYTSDDFFEDEYYYYDNNVESDDNQFDFDEHLLVTLINNYLKNQPNLHTLSLETLSTSDTFLHQCLYLLQKEVPKFKSVTQISAHFDFKSNVNLSTIDNGLFSIVNSVKLNLNDLHSYGFLNKFTNLTKLHLVHPFTKEDNLYIKSIQEFYSQCFTLKHLVIETTASKEPSLLIPNSGKNNIETIQILISDELTRIHLLQMNNSQLKNSINKIFEALNDFSNLSITDVEIAGLYNNTKLPLIKSSWILNNKLNLYQFKPTSIDTMRFYRQNQDK